MCIIATKPYGVKTLDTSLFENCFTNNPDGAGFAFCVKGDSAVRYRKGYMTYNSFKNALDKIVLDRYPIEDVQLLLHYRITTHGGTRQANTHPFPISDKPDKITALKGRAPVMCAMNGIVPADIPKGSTFSDTMQYIKDKLAILGAINPHFYKMKAFEKFILASGAKWTFIDTENIYNFGKYYEHNGWTYSNENYEENWWSSSKWNAPYYSALSYGYATQSDTHIEFEGVIVLSTGEMLEIDFTDDMYISSTNKLYQYDIDTDTMIELDNVVEILDNDYLPTTYTKIHGGDYPL